MDSIRKHNDNPKRRPVEPVSSVMDRRSFVRVATAGLAGLASYPYPGAKAKAQQATRIGFASGPDDTGTVQRLIDAFNNSTSFI